MMEFIYIIFVTLSILIPKSYGETETRSCKPTSPDVLGPYYYPDPPRRRQICERDPAFRDHQHLLVEGRVLDETCQPLEGTRIEVWQADHDGHYIFSDKCRGYFYAEKGGHYAFLTLHPGRYSTDPQKVLFRPAHIHFRLQKPGYDILITQMYFAHDPNLGRNDSCTDCSSDRADLVVEQREMCADQTSKYCFAIAHFDIVMKKGDGISVVKDEDDSIMELLDAAKRGK